MPEIGDSAVWVAKGWGSSWGQITVRDHAASTQARRASEGCLAGASGLCRCHISRGHMAHRSPFAAAKTELTAILGILEQGRKAHRIQQRGPAAARDFFDRHALDPVV